MQEGAGRRGRRHGFGQPDVRGELSALGESAHHDESEEYRVKRAVAQQVTAGEDGLEVRAAADGHDEDEACQHGNAAAARDEQRFESALARGFVFELVGNQQEGRDAGAFPEEEERNQVACQNQPEHGEHEE